MSEAPERLAKLEELYEAAKQDAKEAEAYAGELEAVLESIKAKLVKAVGALEDIVKDCEADFPPSHGAIRYFARTTLAELSSVSCANLKG